MQVRQNVSMHPNACTAFLVALDDCCAALFPGLRRSLLLLFVLLLCELRSVKLQAALELLLGTKNTERLGTQKMAAVAWAQ